MFSLGLKIFMKILSNQSIILKTTIGKNIKRRNYNKIFMNFYSVAISRFYYITFYLNKKAAVH